MAHIAPVQTGRPTSTCSTRVMSATRSAFGTTCATVAPLRTPTVARAGGLPTATTTSRYRPRQSRTSARSRWRSSPADEDEDPMQTSTGPNLEYGLPPISADPPLHTWTRRLLLPWFSHKRVESYVPLTRELCRGLLAQFADKGHADAAADYAQQIPVRVIARILGVSPDLSDTFTGWCATCSSSRRSRAAPARGRRPFQLLLGAAGGSARQPGRRPPQ